MFRPMAQQKTILIVDDDADLRGALSEQLQLHEEFRIEESREGLRRQALVSPDVATCAAFV